MVATIATSIKILVMSKSVSDFPKVSIRTDESGHYGTKIREGGLLAHTPPILRGTGLKIAGKISLGAVRLMLR